MGLAWFVAHVFDSGILLGNVRADQLHLTSSLPASAQSWVVASGRNPISRHCAHMLSRDVFVQSLGASLRPLNCHPLW